jgi:DNA helicase-2/ATP-dependent DNA helicase PcrA
MSASYLAELNVDQRQAVEHGVGQGFRPLLIIAGAGSGKTKTLAHRVAHLLVHGADPGRILLMTFSRRAASEMTRRVDRIVQTALPIEHPARHAPIPWSGTFHAIGARLLRLYAEQIGLTPGFTIHDREDSADLINLVRHDLGLSEKAKRFPLKATCLAIYSRTVNARLPLKDSLAKTFPWCADWEADLGLLFEAYVETKQRHNVLDYDDLILYWSEMMGEAAIAAEIGARFDHVLVDEFQDTNRLQAEILYRLKPEGNGLTVVGDDAQSIYSFRAAEIRNILDFPKTFTPAAAIVTLARNYRSTQPILAASNAVIGLSSERYAKNLFSNREGGDKARLVTVADETGQVHYIVESVLASREAGLALKAQAILFRTAHHSGPLEIELTRRNSPFVKFGGLKFLEAAHVKDLLSVLRWCENPRDRVSGFRALQIVPGIGPVIAGRILQQCEDASNPAAGLTDLRPEGDADWQNFAELVARLSRGTLPWPSDLEAIRLWYEPHLERLYDDARVRQGDLLQLESIAATCTSRERFLTDMTLDPPNATSDLAGVPLLDEDYLVLSTIHSAKGQEWSHVFLLNVVDGCIPSDMATGTSEEIEEERRLLYVAMTRAKEALHLVVPLRFYAHQQARRGDRHMYASRTRFIPDAILPHFQRFSWPRASASGALTLGTGQTPSIDVGARLRGMWR